MINRFKSWDKNKILSLVMVFALITTLFTFTIFQPSTKAVTDVYLSDLTWTSSTNGWGPVEKDKSNGEQAAGDGRTITLNGVTYSKGLGTHASSTIIYNIANLGYTTFKSDIGVDDEMTAATASVVFQVWLDGAKAYDSGVMKATTATKTINISVVGKSELKLILTDNGDGVGCDHGDWANARLELGTTPTPPPSTANIALNKVAYASNEETTNFTVNKAFDGDLNTRWATAWSDPQWVYVDLGSTLDVQRVKLRWESAYGKSYKIQVSNDTTNWTDVYSTTTGDGNIDDINVTPTKSRYVRMYGTQRGSQYGYSLYEFEVYQVPSTPLQQIPAIIPRPTSYVAGTGTFALSSTTSIYVQGNNTLETDALYKTGQYLASKLTVSTGYSISIVRGNTPPSGSIYLTTVSGSSSYGQEGYKLETTSNQVTLTGYTPEGVFRGIQTIRQLLPADIEKTTLVSGIQWTMPCSTITDSPVYAWRGYMLDVARHFIQANDVKKVIDNLAQYKINKVHLHLSDDQGWRLEIKSWPNLALIGGSTQVGGGAGGYYTQEQYTDIVNYAQDRYITIVPEFDMPGHVNAALASYGELNPDGKPKQLYTGTNVGFSTLMCRQEITFTFVSDVVREVAALTPGQYIHLGGDEASSTSQADYEYFIGRVSDIVANNGKKLIGWNGTDVPSGAHLDSLMQHWTGSVSSAVSKGIKIIASPSSYAYLDMKYNTSTPIGLTWAGYIPTDKAYNWDVTNVAAASNIIGVEACLWSETVTNLNDVEFMTFPRMLCYAEIGWTPQDSRNWDDFKLRLKVHGTRMGYKGINFYRDPVVTW